MTHDIKRLASNMRRRKLDSHRLYRLLLMPLTQRHDLQEGYQPLFWLLREGYLATVVTLNSDTQLEDMLYGARIRATILEIGKDSIHAIADALEDPPPGICIVKIPYSFLNNAQLANGSSLPLDKLHAGLKTYLQKATIIVGSVDRDSALVHVFRSATIKSIYYVLPQSPPSDDVLEEIRHEKNQEIFSICDPYGEFTSFFAGLASLIQKESPVSSPSIQPDEIGPIHQYSIMHEYQKEIE